MANDPTRLTHKDRALRRRAIAYRVKSGVPAETVAAEFGVCLITVQKACEEHDVSTLGHKLRAERRARMAEAVRAGASAAEVAAQVGVSLKTVHLACEEHRVPIPTSRRPDPKREAIIAALRAGRPSIDVAREFQLSQSRISQICFELDMPTPRERIVAAAAEKRAAIAREIASGAPFHEVATRYGVGGAHVRAACKEHGVDVPVVSPRRLHRFEILAQLLNTTDTLSTIAHRFGVYVDTVRDVLVDALTAGIQMPVREAELKRRSLERRESLAKAQRVAA